MQQKASNGGAMRSQIRNGGKTLWEGAHEPLFNFSGVLHGHRCMQSKRCDALTAVLLAVFATIFFICVYNQFKFQHKNCLDYLHLDLLLHPHAELEDPWAPTPNTVPAEGKRKGQAEGAPPGHKESGYEGEGGRLLGGRVETPQRKPRRPRGLHLITEELGALLGKERALAEDGMEWSKVVALLEDLQEALFSSPFRSVYEGENTDGYLNPEGYRLMQFTGKACVQLLRRLQDDVRTVMSGRVLGEGAKERLLADVTRVTSLMSDDRGHAAESEEMVLGEGKGQVLEGKPVLFVHGHAGSFTQAKPFGSQVLVTEALERTGEFKRREGLLWREEELPEKPRARDAELLPSRVDLFSTDFQSQWSVMHGTFLDTQAEFVVHCVDWILQQYSHLPEGDRPRKVLVIGHSMGGVVTRQALMRMVRLRSDDSEGLDDVSLVMGDRSTPLPVDAVITIGTPHLLPPFPLEQTTTVLYSELNSFWSANKDGALKNVTIASISGGLSDSNVISELSELPSSIMRSDRVVYAISENIPFVWRGITHVWLVRGRHLLDVVARMTFELLNGDPGPEERTSIFYTHLHDRLALQLGHCKHHYRHWLGASAISPPDSDGAGPTIEGRHPTWVLSEDRYQGLTHTHAVLRELVKEQPVRLGAFYRTPVLPPTVQSSIALDEALNCHFVQRFSAFGCERLGSMENKCLIIPQRTDQGNGHTFTFLTDMEPGVDFQLELLHMTDLSRGFVGITFDCAPVPLSGAPGCMLHLDQAELEHFQLIKLTFLHGHTSTSKAEERDRRLASGVPEFPSVWLEKKCMFSGGVEVDSALVHELDALPAVVASQNRRAMEIVLNPLVVKFFPLSIELQTVAPRRLSAIPPVIYQVSESATSCAGSYHPLLYHYRVADEEQWYTYLHQTSPLLTTPRLYVFMDPKQEYSVTISWSIPAAIFQTTLDYARVGVPMLLVVALFSLSTSIDEYHATTEMPHFFASLLKSFRMLTLPVAAFVVLYGLEVALLGAPTSGGTVAPVEFEGDGVVDEDFIWHTLLTMPAFVPWTTLATASGLLGTLLLVLLAPLMTATAAKRCITGNTTAAVRPVLGRRTMLVWGIAIGALGVSHPPLAVFVQWLFSMAILLAGSIQGSVGRSWENYQFSILCIVTATVWFKLSCIFVALTHPFAAHWIDRDSPALLGVLALSVVSQAGMLPKTIFTARYSGLVLKLCALVSLLTSGHHHYVAIDGVGLACAYLVLVHAFAASDAIIEDSEGIPQKDDKYS